MLFRMLNVLLLLLLLLSAYLRFKELYLSCLIIFVCVTYTTQFPPSVIRIPR
jgi:hypothetical protein